MAIKCLKQLLEDDVINNTYGVMTRLRNALGMIEFANGDLMNYLLRLSSESIREALHKHELHITNAIIEHKNRIFRNSGQPVPEDHHPIDPKKYSWNW